MRLMSRVAMGPAGTPAEVLMEKQMLLPLDVDEQERLRRLWNQLPEQSRVDVVVLYAKLIAQAARGPMPSQSKEPKHEIDDQ